MSASDQPRAGQCEHGITLGAPGTGAEVCAECGKNMTADDFDPRADPNCTPFGIPAGSIPMGTLAEVMGKERADKVLAQMRKVRPPWSAGDFFRRRWTR